MPATDVGRNALACDCIRSVVLDIGETIVNERNVHAGWADWLGVPAHTFSAVYGATVARGGTYEEVLRAFNPDASLDALRRARRESGSAYTLQRRDLYEDVLPALVQLRSMGLLVGIAGNQPDSVGDTIRRFDLPAHFVTTSAELGHTKPDVRFFDLLRMRYLASAPAASVAYIGDRPDHDAAPALEAGMRPWHIRRGPWGFISDVPPMVSTIASLLELVPIFGRLRNACSAHSTEDAPNAGPLA